MSALPAPETLSQTWARILDEEEQNRQPRLHSAPSVQDVWEKLLVGGWTVVADDNDDFNFSLTFREFAARQYYFRKEGILEAETYKEVWPPDRLRARGLAYAAFDRQGSIANLTDLPPQPLAATDYFKGERHYKHTPFIEVANETAIANIVFSQWLRQLITLVPPPFEQIPNLPQSYVPKLNSCFDPNIYYDRPNRPDPRYANINMPFLEALVDSPPCDATTKALRRHSASPDVRIGINLFETYKSVVSGPHRDDTDWVAIYVVDKNGGGAVSELYNERLSKVVSYELQPGQIFIFNDRRFLHNVTPLEPAAEGDTYRDTIICTFDFLPGIGALALGNSAYH